MPDLNTKFELKERIGTGGWGEVWKAWDHQLRRFVAIKLFEPGGSTISSALDHAQALARVNHPNVVHIYETGTYLHPDSQEPWSAIVMELLTGPTLQELCDGDLSKERADDLCIGLMAGLGALHDAGVVHSDLHGGNVMLHGETPKLLDVLYRGTMAVQPQQQRQFYVKSDILMLTAEIANLLVRSGQSDAALAFRRLANDAMSVAIVRDALKRALARPAPTTESEDLGVVPNAALAAARSAVLQWHSDGLSRFRAALAGVTSQVADLYKLGHWSVAYTLSSERVAPRDLLEKMQTVRGCTDWRPWWVPTSEDIRPYSKEGKIECWINTFSPQTELSQRTPANAAFWLVSPDAKFFLLRGYDEDSNPGSLRPGTAYSAYSPMWRIGECVYHAIQMCRLLCCAVDRIDFSLDLQGLKDRRLVFWSSRLMVRDAGAPSHDEHYRAVFSFRPPQGDVTPEVLLAILQGPLDRLFEQFGFAKVSKDVYIQEFARMMKG